jgi:hypothetical protein
MDNEEQAWREQQHREVEKELSRKLEEKDMRFIDLDFASRKRTLRTPIVAEIVERKKAARPQ